jgi:hypothetical protein
MSKKEEKEVCTFKVDRNTQEAFDNLKLWCKRNRVPMGRIMNATLRAMQGLVNYGQIGGFPKQCIINIMYPQQTNIDDHLRYRKRKNLTRVN